MVEPNQWMYIIYHINSIVFDFKTGELFFYLLFDIPWRFPCPSYLRNNTFQTIWQLSYLWKHSLSIMSASVSMSPIASMITNPWLAKDRFSGFWRRVGTWQTPEIFQNFINIYFIMIVTTVIWLKYCWYGVHNSTNAQSTYLATPLCL